MGLFARARYSGEATGLPDRQALEALWASTSRTTLTTPSLPMGVLESAGPSEAMTPQKAKPALRAASRSTPALASGVKRDTAIAREAFPS